MIADWSHIDVLKHSIRPCQCTLMQFPKKRNHFLELNAKFMYGFQSRHRWYAYHYQARVSAAEKRSITEAYYVNAPNIAREGMQWFYYPSLLIFEGKIHLSFLFCSLPFRWLHGPNGDLLHYIFLPIGIICYQDSAAKATSSQNLTPCIFMHDSYLVPCAWSMSVKMCAFGLFVARQKKYFYK